MQKLVKNKFRTLTPLNGEDNLEKNKSIVNNEDQNYLVFEKN